MSQLKLPPRSGALSKREGGAPRRGTEAIEAPDAAVPAAATPKLAQRAQASRSRSGVHKAVKAAPLRSEGEGARAPTPARRSSPAAPAEDDGWNWEAPPAAQAEPSAAPQLPHGRRPSGQAVARRAPEMAPGAALDVPDLFDEGEHTQSNEPPEVLQKAVPAAGWPRRSQPVTRRHSDGEALELAGAPSGPGGAAPLRRESGEGNRLRPRRTSRQELEPVRAVRPSAVDKGAGRGRQQESLAHEGTQELDAPDYGDELDGALVDLNEPRGGAQAPILSSSARASTEEIGGDRLDLARKATPPLELSAVLPRASTQAIDDVRLPASMSEDLFSSSEVTSAIAPSEVEASASFEIPENASFGVILKTLLKQAAFVVAAACRRAIQPLRDHLDRSRQRGQAIEEHRKAALSVQERRVYRIVHAAAALFVVAVAVGIIYSSAREKLPPEAVVKLLYPYGLLDGTFNGRPIAGVESVDIEYVQREPCLEHETEPHCYAYRYKAQKLEGFEGKMLIGINHEGQWQLFNPPKEVVAAVQAKANRKKKRR